MHALHERRAKFTRRVGLVLLLLSAESVAPISAVDAKIEARTYFPVITKGWTAWHQHVHELAWVQGAWHHRDVSGETGAPPEAESSTDSLQTDEAGADKTGDAEQDRGTTATVVVEEDTEEAPAHKRKKRRRRRRRRSRGRPDRSHRRASV